MVAGITLAAGVGAALWTVIALVAVLGTIIETSDDSAEGDGLAFVILGVIGLLILPPLAAVAAFLLSSRGAAQPGPAIRGAVAGVLLIPPTATVALIVAFYARIRGLEVAGWAATALLAVAAITVTAAAARRVQAVPALRTVAGCGVGVVLVLLASYANTDRHERQVLRDRVVDLGVPMRVVDHAALHPVSASLPDAYRSTASLTYRHDGDWEVTIRGIDGARRDRYEESSACRHWATLADRSQVTACTSGAWRTYLVPAADGFIALSTSDEIDRHEMVETIESLRFVTVDEWLAVATGLPRD